MILLVLLDVGNLSWKSNLSKLNSLVNLQKIGVVSPPLMMKIIFFEHPPPHPLKKKNAGSFAPIEKKPQLYWIWFNVYIIGKSIRIGHSGIQRLPKIIHVIYENMYLSLLYSLWTNVLKMWISICFSDYLVQWKRNRRFLLWPLWTGSSFLWRCLQTDLGMRLCL